MKSSFFYPSVGASVVLSQLIPEMPKNLSYVKLRASYASVGVAFERYLANPRYSWNESGLNVDFSLFKGAQVRTDSVEDLLEGSIAFATPTDARKGAPARQGQIFDLSDEVQDEWLQWRPRIAIGK